MKYEMKGFSCQVSRAGCLSSIDTNQPNRNTQWASPFLHQLRVYDSWRGRKGRHTLLLRLSNALYPRIFWVHEYQSGNRL